MADNPGKSCDFLFFILFEHKDVEVGRDISGEWEKDSKRCKLPFPAFFN